MNINQEISQRINIISRQRTFSSFNIIRDSATLKIKIRNYYDFQGQIKFCCLLTVRLNFLHFINLGGQKLSRKILSFFFCYVILIRALLPLWGCEV